MLSKKFLIGQRIGLGFAISIFVLLVIGLYSLRNLTKMQEESSWVAHTIEVTASLLVRGRLLTRRILGPGLCTFR